MVDQQQQQPQGSSLIPDEEEEKKQNSLEVERDEEEKTGMNDSEGNVSSDHSFEDLGMEAFINKVNVTNQIKEK